MTSDIVLRPTLRQKEWEARKNRIGAALGEIGAFTLRKTKDMIGEIRVIKQKELWREGGYASFADFLRRMVGVSRSQIYRLLKGDDEISKVLEINDDRVALWDNSSPTEVPQIAAQTEAEPEPYTAPAKASKMKQAKARIVATEENLPMHTNGPNSSNLPDVQESQPAINQRPAEAVQSLPPAAKAHPVDELVDRLLEEEWPVSEDKDRTRAAIKRIVEAAFSEWSKR